MGDPEFVAVVLLDDGGDVLLGELVPEAVRGHNQVPVFLVQIEHFHFRFVGDVRTGEGGQRMGEPMD